MPSARFPRTLAMSASAVGLALVLAACGSSSKSTSTGAASGSSTTAPASSSSSSSSTPSSAAASSVVSTAMSAKGDILVDAHGKSLYVFDHDTAGKIACLSGCTSLWPPVVVPGGSSAPTSVAGVTATLGTVKRPDGTTQLTSDGRPLYTFNGDNGAGQTNGDGFGGIWHVAKASGNGSASGGAGSAPSSSTSSSSSGY